jgi:hypothetical protein
MARLRAALQPLIHAAQDQVMILDLGKVYCNEAPKLETLGQPYAPPTRAMIV